MYEYKLREDLYYLGMQGDMIARKYYDKLENFQGNAKEFQQLLREIEGYLN